MSIKKTTSTRLPAPNSAAREARPPGSGLDLRATTQSEKGRSRKAGSTAEDEDPHWPVHHDRTVKETSPLPLRAGAGLRSGSPADGSRPAEQEKMVAAKSAAVRPKDPVEGLLQGVSDAYTSKIH